MSNFTEDINDGPEEETDFVPEAVAPSATTFDSPIIQSEIDVIPDRKVPIYVSGSVSGKTALEPSTLKLSASDIKEAIGIGPDQYVPHLSSAKISHFFNPTQQRIGLRVKNSKTGQNITKNAAHARNPASRKMEGFTAVLPSVIQGNLNMALEPEGTDIDVAEAETLAKWRGLKTKDLTDGIMETRVPNAEGVPTVVKYDVPIVRPNGQPQPGAFMLERNKEAFPGFR